MSHIQNYSFSRAIIAAQYNKNTEHATLLRQKQQNQGKLDSIIRQNRAD